MEKTVYNEIYDLVEKKVEGHYWDYKKEWYIGKSADLIHDILCLVNSTHHGNKYIIIGVQNDGTVVGVDNTQRMTQAQVIDAVRKAKFSPSFPSLAVVPIKYKEKTLDVIVIYDSNIIPIVLTEDYGDTRKNVRKNMVYTRANDTNTPVDTGANYWQAEAIWKKHFGLDTTVLNKCKALLKNKEDWSGKLFKEFPVYHKIFPEFQISSCEAKFDYEGKKHPISYFYSIRPSCSIEPFAIMYHQTQIYYGEYLILNDARDIMPAPDIGKIYLDNRVVCYLYFIKDSINGRLLSLTVDSYPGLGRDLDYNPIIYFENESEKNNFEQFLKRNVALFDSFELDIFAKSAIECEQKSQYINPLMAENIWRAKELHDSCKSKFML